MEKKQNKSSNLKIKQTPVHTNFDIVNAIINQAPSSTDPNGSYTGVPLNEYEKPVQDADDL